MKQTVVFLCFLISGLIYPQQSTQELIVEGIDAMMLNNHESSLSLLTKAKSQALEENNAEQLFLAINNIGANYYKMLDFGEALNNYLEAYTIAIRDLEPHHEMTVLNNIAILYSEEENFEKAESYFEKAYLLAKKQEDTVKLGIYAINLANIFSETQRLERADSFFREAISQLNGLDLKIEAQENLARNLYLQGRYTESKQLLQEIFPKLESSEFSSSRISAYITLSNILLKESSFQEAKTYAVQAVDSAQALNDKLKAYEHLSKVYIELEQMAAAIQAKDSVLKITQELNSLKNGRLFETNRVKFEIQKYQNDILTEQQKVANHRTFIRWMLIGCILIFILLSWALRSSYISNKQRKLLLAKKQEIFDLELEKEKTENILLEKQLKESETQLLLEEEKFKNELEHKNRKLAAKALYLSEKNKLISSIIEDLKQIETLGNSNQSLHQHVSKLKSLIKSDEEWKSFTTHFEEVNQGVLHQLKLKHPTLNTNDIRFISYLYMNLTLKEIASILSITPEACRKRKERISKKLNLKDSSTLFQYLTQFN